VDRYIWDKKINYNSKWEGFDMAIEYRKLTEKELDIFIEMRINQLREEGATEDFDLRPALKDYYNRHF
jgi:hypothetical protein